MPRAEQDPAPHLDALEGSVCRWVFTDTPPGPDDAGTVALGLRSVVRRAGPGALQRHWPGSPGGLAAVHRLAGVRPPAV